MEENRIYTETKRSRHGGRMAVLLVAYLCILGVAIRVDGVVEAEAQHQELVESAAILQQENRTAQASARLQALTLEQQTADALASTQAEEQRVRDAAAAEAAAAKIKEGTATKPKVSTVAGASGVFEAGVYGYTGQDKLAYWKSVNDDTIGYLYVPGTNISHAVVENTTDVDYYTKRGYDKKASYYGVLWTNPNTHSSGSSADMSSNTVIYGHNWSNYGGNPRIRDSNDIMFAQLNSYHYVEMARSYPYFYYSTSQEAMTFKIFACFYTEVSFNYIQTEGNTQYIVEEALRRSRYNFHVPVNGNDKIMTLSTCTRAYGKTDKQRFVVMGRLLRPGESITPVDVVANPNHKQPNVWQ